MAMPTWRKRVERLVRAAPGWLWGHRGSVWQFMLAVAPVFLAAAAAYAAFQSVRAAKVSNEAATESNSIAKEQGAIAKEQGTIARRPQLADVPPGPPYDKPRRVIVPRRFGRAPIASELQATTVEVEYEGQVQVNAEPDFIQDAEGETQGAVYTRDNIRPDPNSGPPCGGRLASVLIPIQNVGAGAARITGATLELDPGVVQSEPIWPNAKSVELLQPGDVLYVAPGAKRIIVSGWPGLNEATIQAPESWKLACWAVRPEGTTMMARITYEDVDRQQVGALVMTLAHSSGKPTYKTIRTSNASYAEFRDHGVTRTISRTPPWYVTDVHDEAAP